MCQPIATPGAAQRHPSCSYQEDTAGEYQGGLGEPGGATQEYLGGLGEPGGATQEYLGEPGVSGCVTTQHRRAGGRAKCVTTQQGKTFWRTFFNTFACILCSPVASPDHFLFRGYCSVLLCCNTTTGMTCRGLFSVFLNTLNAGDDFSILF